jgi:hypothetical protein
MKKQIFLMILCFGLNLEAMAQEQPLGALLKTTRVMDEPYRDANVLFSPRKGTPVKILKKKGGWLKVQVNNQTGWVKMFHVRRARNKQETISGSDLSQLASGRSGHNNVLSTTGIRGKQRAKTQKSPSEMRNNALAKVMSIKITPSKLRRFLKKGRLRHD